MKPAAIVSGLALLVALPTLAAVGYTALKPDNKASFRADCEEVLKERLKSPSSYRFISMADPVIKAATEDEFFGWQNPKKKADDQASLTRSTDPVRRELHEERRAIFASSSMQMVSAVLRYEAANSFGAMLAGTVECSSISSDPDRPYDGVTPTSIRVDGYRQLEWTASQYVRAKNAYGG